MHDNHTQTQDHNYVIKSSDHLFVKPMSPERQMDYTNSPTKNDVCVQVSAKRPPKHNSFDDHRDDEVQQKTLEIIPEYGLSESSMHEIPKITNEDLSEEIFSKHDHSNHESNACQVDLGYSNLSPIEKEESTEHMSSSLDKEPVRDTDPQNYESILNKKAFKKLKGFKKATLKPTENLDLGLVRKTIKGKKTKKASTFPHEYNGSKFNSEYMKNYATECKRQIVTQDIVQHSKMLLDKIKKMQLFSNKPKRNVKKRQTKRSPVPMKDVAKLFPNFYFKKRAKSPVFNSTKELDNLLKGCRLNRDKIRNRRRKSIEQDSYTKKTANKKKSPWAKKSPVSRKSPISKKTYRKKSPLIKVKKINGANKPQMIVPPPINYNTGALNKTQSMVFLIRVNIN
jgi:hypothetical protein